MIGEKFDIDPQGEVKSPGVFTRTAARGFLCKNGEIRRVKTLSAREELLTEFDHILWFTVVDTVTVNKDGSLTFRFYDGTEIIR